MRLIDADALKEFVYYDKQMCDIIDEASTIDAVPVVRCKDCKHWDTSWKNDYAPNYHYCLLVDGTRKDDFYCADAERSEASPCENCDKRSDVGCSWCEKVEIS